MARFVLLALIALLFVPVKVKASYCKEELEVVLRFLCFKKQLFKNNKLTRRQPAAATLRASHKKPAKSKRKKSRKKRLSALGQIKVVMEFLNRRMLKSYARLGRCFFCFGVRGKLHLGCSFFLVDAPTTGAVYGLLCGASGWVAPSKGKKRVMVWLKPDFAGQKTQVWAELCARVYPAGVLLIGLLVSLRGVYDILRFWRLSRKSRKQRSNV